MYQILLSINPEHVKQILSGKKGFEFRKVRCKSPVNRIVIYATAPISKVVAEADIVDIIEDSPDKVWNITRELSGISHTFYNQYYKGKNKAVAYKLGKVRPYPKPKTLKDYGIKSAPQSFIYLPIKY